MMHDFVAEFNKVLPTLSLPDRQYTTQLSDWGDYDGYPGRGGRLFHSDAGSMAERSRG